MSRRPPKQPTLPGVEVWWEIIDDNAVALFACRRFDGPGPKLTAWRIVQVPRENWARVSWRVDAFNMLAKVEVGINARWIRYAHNELNRYAEHSPRTDWHAHWAVKDWNGLMAKPEATF